MIVRCVILGEPASKANSRQLVTISGRPAFIKSKKARDFERSAALQVRSVTPLIEGPVRATIRIFYASHRPDLDESVVLDVLQGKVYANDRQVREKHVFHSIDKANPRAEITIEPLQAQQQEIAA